MVQAVAALAGPMHGSALAEHGGAWALARPYAQRRGLGDEGDAG